MTDITHSMNGPLGDRPLTTEGIEDADASVAGGGSESAPPARIETRLRKTLKTIGWVAFGITCLLLFTLLKLPEERIKNYVQGMIAAQLAPKGISFSAQRGYVSVGWGISYILKDVTLNFPPPTASSHIDKVSFSPSILPLLLGYQGGSLWLYNGDGTLHASFSMKNTQISGSFKANAMDLGKLGALPMAAGIRGTGFLTGKGSVSGDSAIPSTLTGDVDLDLSKIVIDQQSIMGFAVPRLNISEAKVELSADKGKATVKTFRVGKTGSTSDDLMATGSGDIMLGRNWDSSTLNGKVNFKLSENVMKAFVLIDALLGAGKQADGSYSYQLSGPLTSPNPLPMTPGSK